jgi:rod shape-determining protein MreC
MRKLFAFLHRRRYTALFLLLLGLTLALLLSQRKDAPGSRVLPEAALELFGPFQKGVEKGILLVRGTWDRYISLVDLKEENLMLREIVEEMKKEKNELTEARLENRRLRSLIGFKQNVPKPLLPAQVIGKDLTGWFQTLLLDRGKHDGIEEGMAVLSVQGIVGQIMESSGNFSRVLLITDPNSAVAAMVQRSRARGVVEGKGFDTCILKYVHRSEKITQGDPVLSSGLDGVYPKGTMIGTVSRVHRKETELFQDVEIDPSVNFNKLEEVIVVCEKAFQEAIPKESPPP